MMGIVTDPATTAEAPKAGGLTTADAALRRAQLGPNQLAAAPPTPAWRRFAAQFRELVIWVLIAAAAVSFVAGEVVDALAIVGLLLLNAVLGVVQELRAERAIAALEQLSAPLARAVRDGRPVSIAASELVPGDLVELEAGDRVPADADLVAASGLAVEEASLTGESAAVEKEAGERVRMGTSAVAGTGRAVVVATGMATELGRIATLLSSGERPRTPLERRLTELGRRLVFGCLGAVLLVAVVQLARGTPVVEVLLANVSLLVAAVPEGLPAVVTVALALGVERMARRRAIVRRLASVETLGCVTVICSDKTGTLTQNRMRVERWVAGDARLALLAGARCNRAHLEAAGGDGGIGDPTELALLVAAREAGIERAPVASVLREVPFDSTRKLMSVLVEEPGGARVLYTKGASEQVLARCDRERVAESDGPLTAERRAAIGARAVAMAAEGLRVLGLAYHPERGGEPDAEAAHLERDLVFIGLVALRDPPRHEAVEAVARCRAAGVRPIMITGDHPATALAIALELGIAPPGGRAASGEDVERATPADLERLVAEVPVFARASPESKMRIIEALGARGDVVAMTGDGVNDAPALKTADIGVAMGLGGTDVAREAADMVLADDNFATIVNAVEEGRAIYENIRKFVAYLLSANFADILLVLVASLAGAPIPLAPVQILWLNLLTNGLPALALALEPAEPGLMRRPPRPPAEPMLTGGSWLRILLQGMVLGIAAIVAFFLADPSRDLARARGLAFDVLVFSQLLFALAARSATAPLARLGLLGNPHLLAAILGSAAVQVATSLIPGLAKVLHAAPHGAGDWAIIGACSVGPLVVIEGAKWVSMKMRRESPRFHAGVDTVT